jgi:hypothetical protein
MTHDAMMEKRSFILTVVAAAGTVIKPTCHLDHARSARAGRDLFTIILGVHFRSLSVAGGNVIELIQWR